MQVVIENKQQFESLHKIFQKAEALFFIDFISQHLGMKGKSGAVRSARLGASAESQHFCLFMSFPPLTYIPVNHTAHQYFQGFLFQTLKFLQEAKCMTYRFAVVALRYFLLKH